MMVVSEMGEQWSPHTAPAKQADMLMTPSGLPTGKIAKTIGIKIPKVPHDVPVAKAIPQATKKMIAGKKLSRPLTFAKVASTNLEESKRPVMFLRLVARVSIKMAGTIAIKPFGMQAMASLKVTKRRATK